MSSQMGITVLREQLTKPWRELYVMMLDGNKTMPNVEFSLEVLEKVQEKVCLIAAKEIAAQLPMKSARNLRLYRWRESVRWALRTHNLALVRDIDNVTRKAIVDEVAKVDGMNPKEAAEKVLAKGLSISRTRAMRISITESTRALNIGIILAANDFPFEMRKYWVHSHDERVRVNPLSHRFDALEGKPLGEPWFNGEYILFPGDPRCSPRNTANCRCFLGVLPVFDSEGNLIPRR